jgi:hypothetical protein
VRALEAFFVVLAVAIVGCGTGPESPVDMAVPLVDEGSTDVAAMAPDLPPSPLDAAVLSDAPPLVDAAAAPNLDLAGSSNCANQCSGQFACVAGTCVPSACPFDAGPPIGTSCFVSADCCPYDFSDCDNQRGVCCVTGGYYCRNSQDCCSPLPCTTDHRCCLDVHAGCNYDTDCCTGHCEVNVCCHRAGEVCTADADCCVEPGASGAACHGGRCCNGKGAFCGDGTTCCSGMCSNSGGGNCL